MRVKSLGKNQTEVSFSNWRILVSYETPVAAVFDTPNSVINGFKTSKYWSVTTSKHINQWFQNIYNSDYIVEEKDQSFFDNLMG